MGLLVFVGIVAAFPGHAARKTAPDGGDTTARAEPQLWSCDANDNASAEALDRTRPAFPISAESLCRRHFPCFDPQSKPRTGHTEESTAIARSAMANAIAAETPDLPFFMDEKTMSKYILQSQQNTNLCIGATSAAAGALVTLQTLSGIGGTLSQWEMDQNTGYITLAADPSLCLDVQGYNGQQGQVIVANLVLGRTSQRWNWVGSPPYISNQAYPSMVIDNSGGNANPGNPVLIWPLNGGQNQKWSALGVPSLAAMTKAAA